MSEIKVGDLVIVARPGCHERNVGKIFRVLSTAILPGSRCVDCGSLAHGTGRDIEHGLSGTGAYIRESRLRKIPPLSELESTEHKEETHA